MLRWMRIRHVLSFALILAIFAIFLVWPIVAVLRVGFVGIPTGHFTLGYVAEVFKDPELRAGLINSALIAVCVTILCLLISLPLAILSVRFDFRGKSIVSALLLVPLILPPFVGAIGMRQILGRFGALTAVAQHFHFVAPNSPIDWFAHARLAGIVLVEALGLYPILFLNISAAIANIDPAMQQAAANLGASRWTIFRRVTLPLLRPGIFAGATIVLIWSFTELGTPLMFDYYRVTPVQIFRRLAQVRGNPLPYALVAVMLAGCIALYLIGRLVLARTHDTATTKATVMAAARPLRGLASFLVILPFAIIITLALLPHIGVTLLSFSGIGAWYQSAIPRVFTTEHYTHALTHELAMPSVRNSIFFSTCSTILDLIIGLMMAFLIVRSRLPKTFRRLVDGLSILPLAVPGLVLAFGYIAVSLQLQVAFANVHWLRDLVDVTENPTVLLIVAYAMRRLPYVVRSGVAGLEQTPLDLELAARNLGASAFLTLKRITLPLIAANLIAGALLAFAFAMLEVSDSLMLAQKQTYWPITKTIYELFQRLGDGPYIASALGVWAMALLTLTILSASSMLGRKMGAVFRV